MNIGLLVYDKFVHDKLYTQITRPLIVLPSHFVICTKKNKECTQMKFYIMSLHNPIVLVANGMHKIQAIENKQQMKENRIV